MTYDPPPTDEQSEVLGIFTQMLRDATSDGGVKRAKGEKPSWKFDTHEPAVWSHINRWKHGERVDPDSGAHPLVHAAWRCLAIAWQETHTDVTDKALWEMLQMALRPRGPVS